MTDSYGVAFGQVEDPARDLLQGTPRTGVTLAAWLGQLEFNTQETPTPAPAPAALMAEADVVPQNPVSPSQPTPAGDPRVAALMEAVEASFMAAAAALRRDLDEAQAEFAGMNAETRAVVASAFGRLAQRVDQPQRVTMEAHERLYDAVEGLDQRLQVAEAALQREAPNAALARTVEALSARLEVFEAAQPRPMQEADSGALDDLFEREDRPALRVVDTARPADARRESARPETGRISSLTGSRLRSA